MVLKPGTGSFALCAGASPVGKLNLHLHKVGQQQEAWSALKLPGIRLCWPWTSENTVDQHHRWHGTQTITDWGNFTLDLKQTWILCLSSLPPELWDPDFQRKCKFTFIREHNFGPLSSSPVLFVFSPGETLLTLSVVQEWLDTRNVTAETHVLHTSVRSGSWSSCSPLFVNLPTFFEWVLFHNPLQSAVIPIACTLFSTTSFPSLRLSINVLGHSSVNSQPLLQWPFVLALLVQGVNGRLLDNCQVRQSSPWLCSLQN